MPTPTRNPKAKTENPISQASLQARKARQEAKRLERQQQEAKADEEFENNRELLWLRLWSVALRGVMLREKALLNYRSEKERERMFGPLECEPWVGVDPLKQVVSIRWKGDYTQASINRKDFVDLEDTAVRFCEEMFAELVRQNAEAEEARRLAELRKTTLAALSEDQKKALGLL